MEQSAATNASVGVTRKRHRASQVCERCRKRKVRCNFAERQPCSNCATCQKPCDLKPVSATLPESIPPNPSNSVKLPENNRVAQNTANEDSRHGWRGLNMRQDMMRGSSPVQHEMRDFISLHAITGDTNGTQRPPSITTSPSAGITASSALTADDEIWSRNLQEMSKTSPEAASTTESVTSPSDPPCQSNSHTRKRVKFSGETLAHSILPVMNGHAELSTGSRGQPTNAVDRTGLRALTAPTSSRPYGKAPWIRADCQAHLDLLFHLPAEDRYYLYNMKGVFNFPQRSVSDRLVRLFFEFAYPLFPIFDRRDIVQKYENLYRRQESSPLLLHSLLFSACQFADEQLLHDAGFASVIEARTYFFQRAKILYSYDCESDHLLVVQSLVLLSFWWMDYTEEKDMRYWTSCAVNLALTMGMHKTLPESLNMSTSRRKLWRRIFWMLYAREHQVATALGQPFLLSLKDCDLDMLSEADFEEHVDECPQSADSNFLEFQLPKQLPCHVLVALKHVELAVRMENLLLGLQGAQDHTDTYEELRKMKGIASSDVLKSSTITTDSFSIDNALSWTRENAFVVFLHLYHERIAMFYYRRLERVLTGMKRNGSEKLTTHPETHVGSDVESAAHAFELRYTDLNIDLTDARAQIVSSAKRAFWMLDNLLLLGLLRYAPSNVITTIFHAFFALTEEIINNQVETPRRSQAKEIFQEGLKVVVELRKYWSAASWCYSMYSSLAENDFKILRSSPENTIHHSQLQSRLQSRYGSPSINNEAAAVWEMAFGDPVLYFDDGVPFSLDPFNEWQNTAPGHPLSAFQ